MTFSRRFHIHRGSRGDTIVEVLIAIAVIGVLLVGSFTTARASQVGVRDSEEHAEATTLVQGQVEQLRQLATDVNAAIYTSNSPFCIDKSGDGLMSPLFPFPDPMPPVGSDDFTQYPDQCSKVDNLYNLSITYDSSSNVFTLRARWDRLSGDRDEVVLFYKINPNITSSTSGGPLPNYPDCASAGATADYYFNFYNFPAGGSTDWQVYSKQFGAGGGSHMISNTYFIIGNPNGLPPGTPIPPGNYDYWAFAKDGHGTPPPPQPPNNNRRLRYDFYDSSNNLMFSTGYTNDLVPPYNPDPANPPKGVISDNVVGAFSVPNGKSVAKIRVEHAPVVPTSDDGLDGACVAIKKTS